MYPDHGLFYNIPLTQIRGIYFLKFQNHNQKKIPKVNVQI